jgi:hypothetical protein
MREAAASSAIGDETRRRLSWSADLLAAILFLALGVWVVLHPFTTGREMPGDIGDPRFNLSMLEFFYRTLVDFLHGRPADFVDAPFFFPWPRVTNFSDTFWGDAEVYAFLRAFGFGLFTSYRIWFLTGFALTFVATFVSLRKLGLRTWGAAAGAFLFTFPLPMTAQLEHAQLVYRLWVPLALLTFHHFLTRRSLLGGAAAVLCVALQLAVSVYLGLFLCLLLGAYTASFCLVARDRLAPPGWAAICSAGARELVFAGIVLAAGLVVLALVAVPYFDVQSLYGFTRSWPEVLVTVPRPGSYLLAGSSELWPNLSDRLAYPVVWEHQMFPGLAAVIPLAWFAFSRRARASQTLAVPMLAAVGILFVFTLDVAGHTLYWLIYEVPGFSAIRGVTRVILVMMLPLAALLGMLIDDLAASRPQGRLIGVVLSGFLIAECSLIGFHPPGVLDRFSSPTAIWRDHLEAIESRLPRRVPPQAILANTGGQADDDAVVVAGVLGIRTLNGYSGNYPPSWKPMETCADVAANIRAGRHFLAEHELPPRSITADQLLLVGFGPCDPVPLARDPVLDLGRKYQFAPGAAGNEFAANGFSVPEVWGRWTDGDDAFLFFTLTVAPAGPITVTIDANSLSPAADRRQVATVFANNQTCGRLVVTTGQPHAEVTCPAGVLRAGDNALRLRIAHPTRPIELGINGDVRRLGLGLISLTVTPRA